MSTDRTPVTMRVSPDTYKRVLRAARIHGVSVGQYTEAAWLTVLKQSAKSGEYTKLAQNEEAEIERLALSANEMIQREGH